MDGFGITSISQTKCGANDPSRIGRIAPNNGAPDLASARIEASAKFKLESLILAQNERWRRA